MNASKKAVVVDPAKVGGGGVQRAWKNYLEGKELRYLYEGLRVGLPSELSKAVDQGIPPERILVVACHACQHLSDETLQIACHFGANAAIMPCCQRDLTNGNVWKQVSKRLGVRMEIVMDILLAGKAMSWPHDGKANSFDVRMKVLEGSSTPQNRLILCRADQNIDATRQKAMEAAQDQLDKAYQRAHISASNVPKVRESIMKKSLPLLGSFCLGVLVTCFALRR